MYTRSLSFRAIALLVSFHVLSSGCTYRRQIPVPVEVAGMPQGLTTDDRGKTAFVTLKSGECADGIIRCVSSEGVELELQSGESLNAIPYKEIARIELQERDYPGIGTSVIIISIVMSLAIATFSLSTWDW